MMSDELRRSLDENEKLRAELKKTKSKLKLKKFEAMQLRHSLERELEDKARRLREESAESTARAAKHARIVATPASMRSAVAPNTSPSSSSVSDSTSPPSLAPYAPPAASVSCYSPLHEFPLAIMQHLHQCLPFLSSYVLSPRDFVIQDLRLPSMAFNTADLIKPFIVYSNPAFNRLIGVESDEPLAGYPLMKLWADSKDCGAAMESLMKNKPPMYISEFIFAEPLVRCASGPPVRISFLTQFFFDSAGIVRYGVACGQSWRTDMPRENESVIMWEDLAVEDVLSHLSCPSAIDCSTSTSEDVRDS